MKHTDNLHLHVLFNIYFLFLHHKSKLSTYRRLTVYTCKSSAYTERTLSPR